MFDPFVLSLEGMYLPRHRGPRLAVPRFLCMVPYAETLGTTGPFAWESSRSLFLKILAVALYLAFHDLLCRACNALKGRVTGFEAPVLVFADSRSVQEAGRSNTEMLAKRVERTATLHPLLQVVDGVSFAAFVASGQTCAEAQALSVASVNWPFFKHLSLDTWLRMQGFLSADCRLQSWLQL